MEQGGIILRRSQKSIGMDVLDFLTHLPVFASLGSDAVQALSAELEFQKIPSGSVLFKQGETGEAFYILASGKLLATVNSAGDLKSFSSEVKPGEFVGEMALLTGQPRSATVLAVEDSELLRLGTSAYERLALTHPNLSSALSSQLIPRFQRDQTRLVLKRFFGIADDALLGGMLKEMDCWHLDSGQTLFRQGEPGDAMYIIIQGRLRFVLDDPSGERVLGEAGAGESAGEFALLAESGAPESRRSATVYATRSTDLIVITRAIFETLIAQYPAVLLNLTRRIVRRATSHDKPAALGENNLAIALVPIHAGQTLERFASQLADALTRLGSTLSLNAQRFDQLYGKAGAATTALDSPLSLVVNVWLDEREREHKHVLYDASPVAELSGWARRCVEKADVILLVAESETDPHLTEIEKALGALPSRPRVELALLHPSSREVPARTAEWLSRRQNGSGSVVEAHYHVREGNQADFRRLARRIVGKPIGLALEGGGARGWAHLGALRALEEADIEVDFIAGASMGAIMASGYALDWSTERLRHLADMFSNPKKLLDYTLPYASITATKRITAMLQELMGETNIEDTWRPFFCISVDLSHGRELTHTRGSLWKAVRSSMAFPAIFAPVLDNGCVLIDGGAANNLPIDRMREMCPTGTVIGVDLLETSPVSGQYDFGASLSGWDVLKSRLSPFAKKVKAPNLVDIVGGIVYSNNRYRLNETWNQADLIIRVPAAEYGLLDFDKYENIIDLGYRAAREQLQNFSLS